MKLTATIRATHTMAHEAVGGDWLAAREALVASVPAGYEIVGAIATEH